jgi:hypothetical protein
MKGHGEVEEFSLCGSSRQLGGDLYACLLSFIVHFTRNRMLDLPQGGLFEVLLELPHATSFAIIQCHLQWTLIEEVTDSTDQNSLSS